jgi:hypothetical protein
MKYVFMSEDELTELVQTAIKPFFGNNGIASTAMEEKLISGSEACKLFIPQISRQTLSNYTKNVPLKVYKLAGRLYYKQSELIAAAKELKQYNKKDL